MSGTSEDPFFVAVGAFIAKAGARVDQALQATALDALARVKELTPVDTGYLRSNWQIVAGSAALAIEGARAEDSQAVVAKLRVGDTLTVVNPVKYARRIEFGFVGQDNAGRTFNQQGRGMMQQTIAELPKIAVAATARIIGEGGVP